MSGASVMRVKKLKGNGIIAVAARHNRRVIQGEMGATGSIDPARSHLNETLTGPLTAANVGQLAKDLMAAAGVGKLRKDAVMGLEIVFSLPPGHGLDDRAYFTACAKWAGTAFGGAQNILSVDIHRDEAAPHCHVLLLPLIDTRMDGSNLLGGKHKIMALQKDFYAVVASKFGLSKAPARLAGTAKQAGAKAVLQKLRETSDSALQSAAWAVIREAVERDPEPFLLALSIELKAPAKTLKPFVDYVTSKGKGPAKEANPIGFISLKREQTLCSVGFGAKPVPRLESKLSVPVPVPATRPATLVDEPESVRVRDKNLDPAMYDPTTGECFKRPPAKVCRQRQAADASVELALQKDSRVRQMISFSVED